MKRCLFFLLLFLSSISSAQVLNFAKTLPVGAFSLGTAAVYNTDTYVSDGGIAAQAFAGYGIGYSLDINFKYGYYTGADYFGVDMQYLFRETRKSYFSVLGGMHYQDDFWFDLTGAYTYAAQYWLNLSVGLDFELGLTDPLSVRAWIPLNAGIMAGEYVYIFFEYDLPANDKAWDIVALGVNFIIR